MQSALKFNERANNIAMQQLSSGKRINSSKDDAAGLAIAARMTQNIKGLDQAVRNAGDGIALIQVADGATSEITNMLQRMSELAIQASNATLTLEQRGYLNEEIQQLKQEINRIADTHEWNGFPILNGKSSSKEPKQLISNDIVPSVRWRHGSVSQTESAELVFKPLYEGQSVSVSGLILSLKTRNTRSKVDSWFLIVNKITGSNHMPVATS